MPRWELCPKCTNMPNRASLNHSEAVISGTLLRIETGADLGRDRPGVLVAVVLLSGPEEAPQAVLAAAGDDVDVHVGHALADAVVHGHEGAVGAEGRLEDALEALGGAEDRNEQLGGEIGQRLVVGAGDQQAVTGEHGAGVEEG